VCVCVCVEGGVWIHSTDSLLFNQQPRDDHSQTLHGDGYYIAHTDFMTFDKIVYSVHVFPTSINCCSNVLRTTPQLHYFLAYRAELQRLTTPLQVTLLVYPVYVFFSVEHQLSSNVRRTALQLHFFLAYRAEMQTP